MNFSICTNKCFKKNGKILSHFTKISCRNLSAVRVLGSPSVRLNFSRHRNFMSGNCILVSEKMSKLNEKKTDNASQRLNDLKNEFKNLKKLMLDQEKRFLSKISDLEENIKEISKI